MIKKELFGTKDGKDVFLFTMSNSKGLTAKITNFGGIIQSLIYKDTDVVLGRDSLSEYEENDGSYGALIGRNSNRIQNAEFTLNGKKYILEKNNNGNNLHSGSVGLRNRVWGAESIDKEEPSLVLTYLSPDGDDGFPGNLNVTVTYTVTTQNSLKIHYEATSDADTIVNMTNHSYFNLNGHDSGTTDNHTLTLNCDFYTPNSESCLPTGEILNVSGTDFDFRSPKKLSTVFDSDFIQAKMFNGLDHNFCINGRGFRKCASATGDISGITMETYTDLPGVQIYTGNFIDPERICKDGKKYDVHHGVCFETQYFVNAPYNSHFPSTFLKSGEKYDTTTEFKFI